MKMENREKQIFDEMQEKQSKLAKKYLLFVFSGSGIVFSVLALVLFCLNTVKELPIVFLSIGLFMIVLGIVLFFVIPTKFNYEKYKYRVRKYGYMNVYEMSAKITELEERIEKLENGNR